MKKLSILIALLMTAFVFTGCDLLEGEDACGPMPLQVVLYSFEDLKTLASFIDADPEDIQDYYNQHELRTSDPVKAARLCSEKLDIRIPCADRFEDFSVEQIYMDSVNSCIDVWYHIGDYRYPFTCYQEANPNLEMNEKIRKEYKADNLLYYSKTKEKITYVYASNDTDPAYLYEGEIIMKDASIYIWILRDIDEETGEYKDGGNPNVDLAQMEKFDFVIVRDLLAQME